MSEATGPGSSNVSPTQTAPATPEGPETAIDPESAGGKFARYVEPEIDVLLRAARSLTGREGNAEDLVQETLIRAYRAIGSFDGAHPRAWLLTILRRTHINMNRRQRPITIEDFEATHRARPAFGRTDQDGPEDQVLAATLQPKLHEAVVSLDPRFRSVLVLIDVDGLTYAEAAAVLDVPVGTVMSRLSRARARVRTRLGADLAKVRRW